MSRHLLQLVEAASVQPPCQEWMVALSLLRSCSWHSWECLDLLLGCFPIFHAKLAKRSATSAMQHAAPKASSTPHEIGLPVQSPRSLRKHHWSERWACRRRNFHHLLHVGTRCLPTPIILAAFWRSSGRTAGLVHGEPPDSPEGLHHHCILTSVFQAASSPWSISSWWQHERGSNGPQVCPTPPSRRQAPNGSNQNELPPSDNLLGKTQHTQSSVPLDEGHPQHRTLAQGPLSSGIHPPLPCGLTGKEGMSSDARVWIQITQLTIEGSSVILPNKHAQTSVIRKSILKQECWCCLKKPSGANALFIGEHLEAHPMHCTYQDDIQKTPSRLHCAPQSSPNCRFPAWSAHLAKRSSGKDWLIIHILLVQGETSCYIYKEIPRYMGLICFCHGLGGEFFLTRKGNIISDPPYPS